jgi:hypothetical protein
MNDRSREWIFLIALRGHGHEGMRETYCEHDKEGLQKHSLLLGLCHLHIGRLDSATESRMITIPTFEAERRQKKREKKP